jgi:hypothetical protein
MMEVRDKKNLEFVPHIPYLVLEKIQKQGFVTGSKRLGGYIENESDIDYVLPPSFSVRIIENYKVGWPCRYDKTEFDSYYVKTKDGEILNLLIMHEQENFDVWKETTRTILRLIKISSIIREKCTNKKHRVALFETIKAMMINPEFKNNNKSVADDDIPF